MNWYKLNPLCLHILLLSLISGITSHVSSTDVEHHQRRRVFFRKFPGLVPIFSSLSSAVFFNVKYAPRVWPGDFTPFVGNRTF